MRRSTAVVPVLVTALVLAVAPVRATASADPFSRYAEQELIWGSCAFTPQPDALPAECALMKVPRDWAAPDAGRDLVVSISRVAASGEHLGSLLLNPGGPGGQGTSLPGALAALQPQLHERYALIGMDPRGTGQEGGTAPEQLPDTCEVPVGRPSQRTDLDARDRSADSIAEHLKLPRAIAEACQSKAIAPYLTTWQTAHDMELVRILLGESALNYLGYSYGTWLGAKYASLFPSSAGKVVLDSSTDFQGRLQASFEAWPQINQRMFEGSFVPWMTRRFPEEVGTTTEEATANWERARRFYASAGTSPDQFDAIFTGMGSPLRWVLGALVFVLGVRGANGETTTPSALASQLDATARAVFGTPLESLTPAAAARALADDPADYRHYPATRYAVACGDQQTRSADWYKRLSDRQGPQHPLFGWQYGLGEPCAFWSDAPRQTLPQLPAEVTGRVLVVQGELDPQTGYEQARSAVRAAPGVSMVAVADSPFHGQYGFEGNPCVDGAVNVFLLHNSRPGNLTCPGLPLPNETEVHPVPGPVKASPLTAATVTAPPLPALRKSVRAMISDVNAPPAGAPGIRP